MHGESDRVLSGDLSLDSLLVEGRLARLDLGLGRCLHLILMESGLLVHDIALDLVDHTCEVSFHCLVE